MKVGIVLAFKMVQGVNQIFKMAASIGLLDFWIAVTLILHPILIRFVADYMV